MEEINNSMEEIILNTASKLFLERGFALTSTVDIAKEAGCNQALVHYYYRSKEKLFLRIFEEKIKLFAKMLFSPIPPDTQFTQVLKGKIETHFDILRKNPKLPFLVVNELLTNPDRIEVLKNSVYNAPIMALNEFQTLLDKEYEAGRIRKTDAKQLLINVLSLNIFSFLALPIISRAFDLEDEAQQERILDARREEIVTTILNSLRP